MPTSPSHTRFKEIQPQQFRALVQLASSGGFTGASDRLGLARSSVWRQVRALERNLGCALIRIRGRRVELTAEGLMLHELLVPVIESFEQIVPEFQRLRQEGGRTLRVAAPSQLLIYEFPPVLEKLKAQHPFLHVRLASETSSLALEMLRRDEVDVAVVGYLDALRNDTSLHYQPVGAYSMVALCAYDHPLARKKRWTLPDLADCDLIPPNPTTSSRPKLDAVFAKHGLLDRLKITLETSSHTSVIPYVRKGFGVGVLSVSPRFIEDELEEAQRRRELTYRVVDELFGQDPIFFVTRGKRASLPYLEDFRVQLERAAAPVV